MAAKQRHCYDYPHPAVTTDVVLFTIRQQTLSVLLIQRANHPFQGMWALPGGFLEIDEDLETCAKRELMEETGITGVYLEQLYTFGNPQRDPRERIISVTYFALSQSDSLSPKASSDAAQAAWFPINELPALAFDHREIVQLARRRLLSKLSYSTIVFQMLPPQFTLSQLQSVYEILLNENLDKRNFRKGILARNIIEETGDYTRSGNHRPAKIYRVVNPSQVEIIK
ncbi:MAG: NUDIX hydrolase [gamma proteobacterium symbiont of Ctena orbiculata]|uniref:NUDIX hydrolase n=1 Tax=Candidatus Thiodiazotropha taylori TaxID=2792791 RepID=A0A944QRL9_9GAMM|nr:NUDIX hydrolase [Candidatus Thiodiazotropha taylori]PUB86582.1 MAG: NUDIX hydrolase [gamma proteobacterium symbiont of Ctena orbiculata]MBT2987918.1 NUDIX hydrolase [Candidatus Thiodiazotropha taylori]MBT2997563.1 NUDIX hydrolase [Candidatus Thiodiazotropha taylori]MBT2999011.1 NUDIX hydrolase [Candidatus Thiodiazotropha taylori]